MKVYGYFDEKYEPPAPFVRVLLMSGRPRIKLNHKLPCSESGCLRTVLF